MKATEKDMTPVVLTVDTLITLVERMGSLEREVVALRQSLSNRIDMTANDSEEAINNVYKHCIPDISPDGRLVFKAYNNIADPVQAFVQAEIVEESAQSAAGGSSE